MATPVFSHEFWIEPESFQVETGAPVVADFRNGQNFKGGKLSWFDHRIARSESRVAQTVTPLTGRAGDMPAALERRPGLDADEWVLRGGSVIYGPDGHAVVEPVFEREALLIADLDPTALDREAMTLDVSGHYHRPDVFDFRLRPTDVREPEGGT